MARLQRQRGPHATQTPTAVWNGGRSVTWIVPQRKRRPKNNMLQFETDLKWFQDSGRSCLVAFLTHGWCLTQRKRQPKKNMLQVETDLKWFQDSGRSCLSASWYTEDDVHLLSVPPQAVSCLLPSSFRLFVLKLFSDSCPPGKGLAALCQPARTPFLPDLATALLLSALRVVSLQKLLYHASC